MDLDSKERMTKYLERQYENISSKTQAELLNKIVKRISTGKKPHFDEEHLFIMIEELKKSGWTIASIMAHLDLLDYEERT